MARKRSSEYPAVPTTLELGYPDLMASLWFGMVGPAGMPSALAASIVSDIRMVLDNPDVVRRYPILQNYTITHGGSADFADRVKKDTTIFGNLARISKLEPQ
jgi:tripartite-type tricarboxylate transporter receptor subunit TctC